MKFASGLAYRNSGQDNHSSWCSNGILTKIKINISNLRKSKLHIVLSRIVPSVELSTVKEMFYLCCPWKKACIYFAKKDKQFLLMIG
jgi:hypothetical protein